MDDQFDDARKTSQDSLFSGTTGRPRSKNMVDARTRAGAQDRAASIGEAVSRMCRVYVCTAIRNPIDT